MAHPVHQNGAAQANNPLHPASHLGFADLQGPPQVPLDEEYAMPDPARILDDLEVLQEGINGRLPPISLVSLIRPSVAYAVLNRDPILIEKGNQVWGHIHFAVKYYQVSDTQYRPPLPNQEERVCIKKLFKSVVDPNLAAGCDENPYREVARMNEFGDDRRVLRCLDFIEDKDHLYIVTQEGKGTLRDLIAWGKPHELIGKDRVKRIFRKLLLILDYLVDNNICHHDVSPDNFLFLDDGTEDGCLVAFDLAKSIRMPTDANGNRMQIFPMGNSGTHGWMSPEVYLNLTPFDGLALDLYGVSHILYNLLTNLLLYRLPDVSDGPYVYFVFCHGLSSNAFNERAVEFLHRLNQNPTQYPNLAQKLQYMATMHINLTPDEIDILERLLDVNPANRLTLAQAWNHPFTQQGL